MKDLIIKLPARAKSAIVGLWLGGCLLLAVFPPFYLAAGGQSALVLGMPLAIAYWLIDAVLLVAGIAFADARGAPARRVRRRAGQRTFLRERHERIP